MILGTYFHAKTGNNLDFHTGLQWYDSEFSMCLHKSTSADFDDIEDIEDMCHIQFKAELLGQD